MLAGERESLLFDSSDRNFYRLRQQAARSVPTLPPSTPSTVSSPSPSSRSSGSSFEYFDTFENLDSDSDMDESMFRWMDEESELDLRLDDYHTHLTTKKIASPKSKSQIHLPSFRRNLSLSTLPTPGNSSPSSPAEPVPLLRRPSASRRVSVTSIQQALHRRVNSKAPTTATSASSFLPIQHNSRSSILAIDPQAAHYTDPVTRHKLRNYLASPSKFDEAIEFGFPSLQDQTSPKQKNSSPTAPRPSLSSLRGNKTAPAAPIYTQTFFNSSSLSLLSSPSSNNGSNTSLPETSGPHTPEEANFRNAHRLPLIKATGKTTVVETSPPTTAISEVSYKKPSTSSSRKGSEPYIKTLAPSTREMTLKMTLTRPDLRSEKEVTFYGMGTEDPLALEKLPPASRGGAGVDIWDSLAQDGKQKGSIRRIWRKISGKA